MSKWFTLAITTVMLVLFLAACGGGDDDEDPTATTGATATTAATATESSVAAEPSATATVQESTATATVAATAPPRPIVTATPTTAPATATPATDDVSDLEARMLATLLQADDFTGDWVQDTFGLMEPSTDDDPGICSVPPFPDRDQRIAGVEAQYSLNTGDPAFIFQNIVLFPDATAVDAMAFARDASSCTEWTDEDGRTYTMLPISGPDFGDESLSIGMTFDADGTPLYSEYTFVRVGGAITTIAFITVDGADATVLQELIASAAQRLEVAGIGQSVTSGTLADAVLVAEDIALIDSANTWLDVDDLDASDPERFGFCGAESFPDVLGSVDEIGRSIDANDGAGPFAMHTIVELFEGDGTVAMEWIRAELSCDSWSDDDGEYAVPEVGDLEVGDDTYWILVDLLGEDGSTVEAQVGLGFTQIGDYISVVGLAGVDNLDLELFGGLMALAAQKVIAIAP